MYYQFHAQSTPSWDEILDSICIYFSHLYFVKLYLLTKQDRFRPVLMVRERLLWSLSFIKLTEAVSTEMPGGKFHTLFSKNSFKIAGSASQENQLGSYWHLPACLCFLKINPLILDYLLEIIHLIRLGTLSPKAPSLISQMPSHGQPEHLPKAHNGKKNHLALPWRISTFIIQW